MTAASLVGAAARPVIRWVFSHYVSKSDVQQREIEAVKQQLQADDHVSRQVVLNELENLANNVNAHIEHDNRLNEQIRNELEALRKKTDIEFREQRQRQEEFRKETNQTLREFRQDHSQALQQILAAVKK